jgi:CheY-like chemotaxis protein
LTEADVLVEVPSPPGRERLAAEMRLAGLHILAAEDDAVNQWVLRDLLEQEGARCTMVASGIEALELLSRHQDFDLFLTDVQMPGLSGYDTARRCRERHPGLPIIGLTAYAMAEDRQHCLDSGMAAHVAKPVDANHLCAVIMRILGHQPDAPASALSAPREPMDAVEYGVPSQAVNWNALWQRLRQTSKIQQILEAVVETHAQTPSLLRNKMVAMDVEGISEIAHKLHGMAGTVCAEPVRSAAALVENRIRMSGRCDAQDVAALGDAVAALVDAARVGLEDVAATQC